LKNHRKKYRNFSFCLTAAVTFIMISSLMISTGLVANLRGQYGIYGSNKIIANIKQPYAVNQPKGAEDRRNASSPRSSIADAINLDEFNSLQEFMKQSEVSAISKDTVDITNKIRNAKVNVFGVNDKYAKFSNINMLKGRFLALKDMEKASDSVVIDKNLAEKLFNSIDILGLSLKIYDKSYRIVGVCENDASIIQSFIEDGKPYAFITLGSMNNNKGPVDVTTLETNAGRVSELESALRNIGKNPSAYKITEASKELQQIEQKYKVLVFILGILIIIRLLKDMVNSTKHRMTQLKNGTCNLKSRKNLYHLIKLTLLFILAVMLWKFVSFSPYIQKEYIPSDMPDYKFFKNLFESSVRESLLGLGYIPSLNELRLNTVKHLTDVLFYMTLFAALPLYFISKTIQKLLDENAWGNLIVNAIIIILASTAAAGITLLLKLPVTLGLKYMLLIFMFMLYEDKKYEEEDENENEKDNCIDMQHISSGSHVWLSEK
jgi:hypothetical protein